MTGVAQAQVETDFSSGGGVIVGDSTSACPGAPSIEGAIRYDADGSDTLDYCTGSGWVTLLTSSISGAILNNGNSFAAPMIIGTNDANNLSFETNNAVAVTIDTTGNVGIGTTAPSAKLQSYSDLTGASGSNLGVSGTVIANSGSSGFYTGLSGWAQTHSSNSTSLSSLTGAGGSADHNGSGNLVNLRGGSFGTYASGPTITNVLGVNAAAYVQGTTTVTSMYGLKATATKDGSGTTTSMFGVYGAAKCQNGTCTDAYGGYFEAINDGLADPVNGYGVYIGDSNGSSLQYGIYQAGTDDLNYFAGNLGIGTTTPAVELDVNTGTINAASICDENNANCLDLSAGVGGGGDPSYGSSAASPNDAVYVNDSGFVGIGTTSPANPLSVNDRLGVQLLNTVTGQNITDGLRITMGDGGDNNNAKIANEENGYIAFSTSGYANERMRIDSQGNVGVGTANPWGKLTLWDSDAQTELTIMNDAATAARYPGVRVINYMGTPNSGHPRINLVNSRGSDASPSAVVNGDVLGSIDFSGIYNTSWGTNNGAFIQAEADENWSATNQGTRLTFDTTPIGATFPTEKMRIDAAGKVGIGTNAPAVELDVNAGTINAASICDENNANCLDLSAGVGGGGDPSYGSSASSPNDAVYVDDSGNVAIGTTVPTGPFSVYDATPIMELHDTSNARTSANMAGGLEVRDQADSLAGYMKFSSGNGDTDMRIGVNTSTGNGGLKFETAGVERMHIDHLGNVGIGVTNPSRKLSVEDDDTNVKAYVRNRSSTAARYPGFTATNYNGGFGGAAAFSGTAYRGNSGTPAAVQSGDYLVVLEGAGGTGVGYGTITSGEIAVVASETYSASAGGSYLRFRTTDNGTTTPVERMRISYNGRVGIGTTTPDVELDVNTGAINAASICDENNANCKDISAGWAGGSSLWTDNAGDIYYNTGSVGIGTDTPATLLDVRGASANGSYLMTVQNTTLSGEYMRFLNSSGIQNFGLNQGPAGEGIFQLMNETGTTIMQLTGSSGGSANYLNANGFSIGDTTPDAHLEISANGTTGGAALMVSSDDPNDGDLFIINENGNVGIGTTAPLSALHVDGASGIRLTDGTNSSNDNRIYGDLGDMRYTAQGGHWFVLDNNNTGAANDDFRIYDESLAGSLRFIVEHTGNVGIGTANPAGKLEVAGNFIVSTADDTMMTQVGLRRNSNSGMELDALQGFYFNMDTNNNDTNSVFNVSVDAKTTDLFTIVSSGNVGIGTTAPAEALDVVGNIQYTGSLIDASDRRLKRDIASLEGALDRLTQVEGVSFIMKDDPREQVEYGVIAQDIEPVFPELVHTKDDERKTKSVKYMGFIAWIIEAIKELAFANQEQDNVDAELTRQVRQLAAENQDLKAKSEQLESELSEKDQELKSLKDRLDRIEQMLSK